jgi:hypothetical protein
MMKFSILLCAALLFVQTAFADTDAIQYGFTPGDPSFDNSVVLNNYVANVGADRTLHFPSGTYYFNTAPNTITKGLVIRGDGINNTSFIRNYTPSSYADALIHTTTPLVLENLGILAATEGGGAIKLDGLGASASVLRDLYITAQSGGNWAIPLTLISGDPLGIRGVNIDNVELFAATMQLAWFVNVQGLTANFNAYPAGGTANHIVVQGSGSYHSSAVKINTRHLVTAWLYDTDNISIDTLGTTVNQQNCTNVVVK